MDYGMIGKIEKAKIYAEERERIEFEAFRVTIVATTTHTLSFTTRAPGIAIALILPPMPFVDIPWPWSGY